jgi:catalase
MATHVVSPSGISWLPIGCDSTPMARRSASSERIAEKGDKVEDPSIAWPDSRKTVKLGTFSLTKITDDQQAAQKTLGQPHPDVEPADPMLVLRNTAYPISFGERQ